ncbi:septum formation protein [Tenacibaculum mesophilum]|uniref:dTTP/UTP pyrophosphatase n=1 Tax=Tenacibaculum mesophilum TaxID=104268 RepID=A0ABM7CD45_9FLAO|nr:Maf-like protein [Tenacibaculum mesophilum]GFD92995.1 Maf-like protein [Alteromonas sp. KUL154]GFE03468.1 Maf-like protein [Alteromonas sp. KUL156]AZJ31677.1 septum formation protein Maf [Tenacibaculum mesophilum]QFS26931.1 septum formation protein Maf [Tenacibaculum mesophilum]SHG02404.1 septum formation protein [Tenacibaculum mesophilum]
MLSTKLSQYSIILASSSPRRQELIKSLNIPFTVKIKDIEEIYPEELQQTEITDFLADLKAIPFKKDLKENELLITSDTIVWINNEALGKPKNYNEAFQMLKKLSNTTHKVITSICITNKLFQKTVNDTTIVSFKELLDDEIDYYIKTYQPFDKAGAYGIQEWIGKIGITKIEGSYFNVMGFPVHKLYKELSKL